MKDIEKEEGILYPLRDDEKQLKNTFLKSDGFFWSKPMTFPEYDRYDQDGLIAHTPFSRYYKIKTRDCLGITVDFKDTLLTANAFIHPRYSYPVTHNHDYIEMLYVLNGSCVHFINNETLNMKRGDVWILSPNVFHAISCTSDDCVIVVMMMTLNAFDARVMNIIQGGKHIASFIESILYHLEGYPYIKFETDTNPWLTDVAMQLIDETQTKSYAYDISIQLLFIEFMLQLIRNYDEKAIVPPNKLTPQDNVLNAVLKYLSVNYAHTSLNETANYFAYSPAYLSRIIKDHTGRTFNSVLNEIKMEKAADMLLKSNKPMSAIATEVGCFDTSHFCKKFKSYFGMSPKQYIIAHQANR